MRSGQKNFRERHGDLQLHPCGRRPPQRYAAHHRGASQIRHRQLFIRRRAVHRVNRRAGTSGIWRTLWQQLKPKRILECLDMDVRTNPQVQRAQSKIRSICMPLCEDYRAFIWPVEQKGIDDFLLFEKAQARTSLPGSMSEYWRICLYEKHPVFLPILSYADWRDYKIHMVNMSHRDLQIIVDVLDDYSWLFEGTYGEEPAPEFLGKSTTRRNLKTHHADQRPAGPMLSASTSPTPIAKSTWKSSRRPRMMSEERR